MTDNTTYDDSFDPDDQDGACSSNEDEASSQDVRKNLLEDFAAPSAKLTRQSVAHSREHMQVHLRIRPFTNKELDKGESQDCMEIILPSSLLMRAPKDSFTFKSSQRGFSNMTHKFTFSRIFGQDTSQKEFFDETMLGTVKDFIDGQNCLVFTYGVTNAGKTYTIQGVPQDGGILPRSLDVIFNSLEGRLYSSSQLKPRFFCDVVKLDERQIKKEEYIKESVLSLADGPSSKQEASRDSLTVDENDDSRASNYTTATEDSQSDISLHIIPDDGGMPNVLDDLKNRIPDDTSVDVEAQGPLKFSVWVSFAEVYNEYIYDLLEPVPKGKKIRRQPLKLSEDKNGQIYIKGLKEVSVTSADEAYKVLKIGQQNLSMAATKLNQCSSRSHCIFSIKILRVVDVDNPHVARVSQLSFCDLAGSERYTRTQNTGDRLKEAGNINTSLLTLGKCIHTLRYNQNHPKCQPKIIPFRESKLTRLFQSFFMGKGKASMVVNVNQCASGFDETIQVLKFSAIAKQVTTVTSKLDNKWKVPSAAAPKLPSSRALSLALRQSLSRNRVSVPWATPGPQRDTNLDLTTVDESFIEEEDEDEEDEEDEEEDEQRTPRDSGLEGESRAKLLDVVEALKAELIEQKKQAMMMEMQIREEVCREMAQQLVQIEDQYRDQMEKERIMNEEMFEKRLEMYEKTAKEACKRPRTEEGSNDDNASSHLLREEQVKVQKQTEIIKGLHRDVKKLKEALEEAEEKMTSQDQMLTELQGLTAAGSKALEEAKAKLCAKDEKLLEMQASLRETQDEAARKETELNGEVHALTEKVTAAENAMKAADSARKESQEKQAVVQEKHTKQVSQFHAEFKILQERLQSFEASSKTDKDLSGKLAAALSEAANLREQLKTASDERSTTVSSLEAKTEELQNRLNESEALTQNLKFSLEEAKSQLSCAEGKLREVETSKLEVAEDLQSKTDTLRDKLKEGESRIQDLEKELDESKTEKETLMEKLSSSKISNSEVVAQLERRITELKQELLDNDKEDERELDEAKNQTEEIKKKLTSSTEEHEKETADLMSKISHLQEQMSQSESEYEKRLGEARQETEMHKLKLEDLQKKYDTEVASLQGELKASSKTLARVGMQIEREKQKSFDAEEKVVSLEEKLSQLEEKSELSSKEAADGKEQVRMLEEKLEDYRGKVSDLTAKKEELESIAKDMEEVLVDMQTRFDQTNTKGQEAAVRVASLENNIEYLKEEVLVEQKAHAETKKLASEYGCQVSLLRSQLETAERTAASSSNLAKRIKELEGSVTDLQQALTEKEVALAEASKWQGSATDLRSQLKALDDKLKEAEGKRSAAEEMVQSLSSRCTGLQQSLAQKDRELDDSISKVEETKAKIEEALTEIQQLKDKQVAEEERCKVLDKALEELKAKTKSKADTIKSLMSEVEMQCHKQQAAEKDSAANKEMVSVLKAAMQEQETTMARQDEILASKEEELDAIAKELEELQGKYSDLLKTSSDSQQEVRAANKNFDRWMSEKENMKKEKIDMELRLCKLQQEREDLKMQLSESETALADSSKEVATLQQDFGKLRDELKESQENLTKAQEHPADCPDKVQAQKLEKKVAALEQEVMKQVASKEETLTKWREERDNLVKALEQKMTSILETQKMNEAALAEKDEHIEHLKTKMMENLSDSQAVTDDNSDVEETAVDRRGRRKGHGKASNAAEELQREIQQLREQLEKEKHEKKKARAESERILAAKNCAISELEGANMQLQKQLGLIEVPDTEEGKPSSSGQSDSSSPKNATHSSSPQALPESPDLFSVDVKDQESFHQPGRRRTRVEIDVTPLQKKQPARKTRANTRRAKKRKSIELLEEIDMETVGKRSRADDSSSNRVTRSSRRKTTRPQRGDTDMDDENMPESKAPEEPPAGGRGKRAAFSKIGDLLQNTPLAKSASSKSSSRPHPSAKKFVESAAAQLATSPTNSPDVQMVAYQAPPPTTEKKRKRRLLKTDISVPFETSPFEVLNVGEPKSDNSHSIVTRKLRSRNTKV